MAVLSCLSLGLESPLLQSLLLQAEEVLPSHINEIIISRHEVPWFGFTGLQTFPRFFILLGKPKGLS